MPLPDPSQDTVKPSIRETTEFESIRAQIEKSPLASALIQLRDSYIRELNAVCQKVMRNQHVAVQEAIPNEHLMRLVQFDVALSEIVAKLERPVDVLSNFKDEVTPKITDVKNRLVTKALSQGTFRELLLSDPTLNALTDMATLGLISLENHKIFSSVLFLKSDFDSAPEAELCSVYSQAPAWFKKDKISNEEMTELHKMIESGLNSKSMPLEDGPTVITDYLEQLDPEFIRCAPNLQVGLAPLIMEECGIAGYFGFTYSSSRRGNDHIPKSIRQHLEKISTDTISAFSYRWRIVALEGKNGSDT